MYFVVVGRCVNVLVTITYVTVAALLF